MKPVVAILLGWVGTMPAPAAAAQDPVEELLRLHYVQRAAHVLGDETMLTKTFGDRLTEVSRGRIQSVPRDAARERFGSYFSSVRFLEWEDVRPPRIRVSHDSSWAEVMVEKRVRTVPGDSGAARGHGAQRFAWVERWDRSAGAWRLSTIASTDRPEADTRAADLSARRGAYEILSRAREAVGGPDAVARIAMLRFVAECEGPNGPFVTEIRSARDGRVSFTQRLASGEFAAGVDLEGPWRGAGGASVDSLGGVLATIVAAHELHLLAIAPEARYRDPVALPSEMIAGRTVDVVELIDALGAPVRFYYDAANGMPAGFRPINHSGRGATEILILFDDWRAVGDVILPHTIRIEQGPDRYFYRVVEASAAWLDDRAFRPRLQG